MIGIVIAAALFAAASSDPGEIAHAIEAGRLDQARAMIAAAVREGESGPVIDRLSADLALKSGDAQTALAGYERLLAADPGNAELAGQLGIAALLAGRVDRASSALDLATRAGSPSWRVWNALGVLADREQRWSDSAEAYGKAIALAPGRAEILNNMGWSALLRGDSAGAIPLLEQALAADPRSSLIADNLELARAAADGALPQRRAGESDADFAARLNDAGIVALHQGQQAKAKAAFAQAIEVRADYYERASNNLATLKDHK